MAVAATQRQAAGPDRRGEESELLELIRARSFRLGRFTLSSGAERDLYFNLKPTTMAPRGAHLAARAFLARILADGPD
jgi:orotate phosphoribosyltransferase